YLNRGLVNYNLKLFKESILDFDKVIHQNPNNVEAYENRAISRATLLKKEAIDDFNKVVELKPKDALSYYNRALYFINFKVVGDYCSDLNKAMSLGLTQVKDLISEKCK
ncbi:MAG: tetratricopeptide repeat protein, partial [Flavobacterium sp.]